MITQELLGPLAATADIPPVLLGAQAALALSLLLNWAFVGGRIHSPKTVPRVDYEALVEINRDYAAAIKEHAAATTEQTRAMDRLIIAFDYLQRNGGPNAMGQKER